MSNPGTTNLVAYWELNEESGTRVDSHASLDLTDNNTVLYSASGVQGNAADFELSNSEYLSRASEAALQTGDIDFTLGAWVKPESIGSIMGIITKWNASPNRDYGLSLNADGTVRFFTFDAGDAWLYMDSTATLSAGTWYFITGWHSTATNKVYIKINDASPEEKAVGTPRASTAAEFRVGSSNVGPYHFDGLLDEAFFYKKVLSSAELTWLYNSGSGRSYANVAATTISPPVGALTLAGLSSSLQETMHMDALGELTLAGLAPSPQLQTLPPAGVLT